MYDSVTIGLMTGAPPLEGLDPAELPKMLTKAYAEIVAARIRVREGSSIEHPEELEQVIVTMRKLAFTNEALVSANVERENRLGAAFVAGSAHHVVLMGTQPSEPTFSHLSANSISSEVAATILFLIAEASADAAEMAKRIVIPEVRTVESILLTAIKDLANGSLLKIVESHLPSEAEMLSMAPEDAATGVLYGHIYNGVVALANQLLGKVAPYEPDAFFAGAKDLAIDDISRLFDRGDGTILSIYPGPYHLASLLSAVGRELAGSALVRVAPPPSTNVGTWQKQLRHIAESRPFLWSNHREAISAGYLNPGTSAAISFPTGAGKSTLSELKIAAALARGLKTVFLAPTLALVDQTVKALEQSFPDAKIDAERSDDLLDLDLSSLQPISVMTPERCLAILSFDRSVFSGIGLLIFDECHLLHPRSVEQSRRALDAMLCLLNFVTIATDADVLLLSAMMQNSSEMAAWVEELTGRRCLSLSLNWKPTRQIRGCVVYNADAVRAMRSRVTRAKNTATTKGPPVALKRSLTIQPYGFFGLRQTWISNARSDYSLIPLLDHDVLLSLNPTDWYLTANANQVSSSIAAASGGRGFKTLVFVQTIPLAIAAANSAGEAQGVAIDLTSEEERYYGIALDEIGDVDCMYLALNGRQQLVSSSVCHHGDLLSPERNLHESLFRRPDGVNIMVATSTLAQGMNLPSEIVIISGDSRFDQAAEAMEHLEAHELLNAAGRAGRAGKNSHGMVIVVPSKVTPFDNASSVVGSAWTDLQAIFSQSDQCLTINDPMEALLDQVASQSAEVSDLASYLVSRLPVGDASDPEGIDGPAEALLRKSFVAFKARQRSDQNWITTRVSAAMLFRSRNPAVAAGLTWIDRLAAAMAMPVEMVRVWAQWFAATPIRESATVLDWLNLCYDWLKASPTFVPAVLRRGSLESLLGKEYKELTSDAARGSHALGLLLPLLDLWMAGEPLNRLQTEVSPGAPLKKCEKAREFALRIVPELAYLFSLPSVVHQAFQREQGLSVSQPLGLSCMAQCVREGLDSVEKLAYRQLTRARRLNRRAVHREFADLAASIAPFQPGDELSDVINRIERITR